MSQLIDLLAQEKVKRKIIEALKNAHESVQGYHSLGKGDWSTDDEKLDEEVRNVAGDDWQQAWHNLNLLSRHHWEVLDSHVFAQLNQPWPMTPEELLDEIVAIGGVDSSRCEIDFDMIWEALLSRLDDVLSTKRSPVFSICKIQQQEPDDRFVKGLLYYRWTLLHKENPDKLNAPDEKLFEKITDEPLWKCGHAKIAAEMIGPEISETIHLCGLEPSPILYATITGSMSESALATAKNELARLLPMLIRCVFLLETDKLESAGKARSQKLLKDTSRLPEVKTSMLLKPKRKEFLHDCLDIYYMSPNRRSLDRYIQNAIHLLLEADTQQNNAVSLALSISALEALLGIGNDKITENLAKNVAVLLEPIPQDRSKAENFVKSLYNLRS